MTPVHIEISVKPTTKLPNKSIQKLFDAHLSTVYLLKKGKMAPLSEKLRQTVHYVLVDMAAHCVSVSNAQPIVHIFRNHEDGMIEELDEECNSEDAVNVANSWNLPNKEFDGLYESLIFDDNVKQRLLNYMKTLSVYRDVDKSIITWNGIILLYGPPGTGKTSLCKALAQKLAIRSGAYEQCMLMEINAHSLFSKWFAESGKLVQKLFSAIREMVEDSDALIFVLIDEVESLATDRATVCNKNEPSDSVRAVNALLTQIDQLKAYPNVLILATSNISQCIDLAFIDRADMKQFIGTPSIQARYQILDTCLSELVRKNVVYVPAAAAATVHNNNNNNNNNGDHQSADTVLLSYEAVSMKSVAYHGLDDVQNETGNKHATNDDHNNNNNNNNNGDHQSADTVLLSYEAVSMKSVAYHGLDDVQNETGNKHATNDDANDGDDDDDDMLYSYVSPIPFAATENPKTVAVTHAKTTNQESQSQSQSHHVQKAMEYKQRCSEKLYALVHELEGLSGRALRKLPFITSVNYVHDNHRCSLMEFLEYMQKMGCHEQHQRNKLNHRK
eukprot:CAMPEP_0202727156 /NCGR_PEP_ID=MMETSP1385-20130828/184978_1 /ASSEMBLY_ACC=CAM_ASM_000861 /TAXON_ID=933848 /ORGANISM="Elphidium margaritaceum" /LENGTH=557 /DNA_ID=CAMNT_0049393395 /DNA_START=2795 /DNA_END=4468 /DNA_ORIENTATION=-